METVEGRIFMGELSRMGSRFEQIDLLFSTLSIVSHFLFFLLSTSWPMLSITSCAGRCGYSVQKSHVRFG